MFFLVGFAPIKRFLCATKFDNCPHSQRYVYQFAWKPVFSRDNSSPMPFRESISTNRSEDECACFLHYIFTDRQTRVNGNCYVLFEIRNTAGRGKKKKILNGILLLKNRKSANRRMQNILRENVFSRYSCY